MARLKGFIVNLLSSGGAQVEIKKGILMAICAVISLSGCAKPNDALFAAQQQNTIAAYEAFINQYPSFATQVRSARWGIAKIRFQQAIEERDLAILKELSTHPDAGPKLNDDAKWAYFSLSIDIMREQGDVEGLKQMVGRLRGYKLALKAESALDDARFQQARQINTEKAYLKYQNAEGSTGLHVDAAKQAIEQLYFEEAKATATYAAWRDFMIRYPQSRKYAEVQRQLELLEGPLIAEYMEGLDLTARDTWGGTPLHAAVVQGDLFRVKACVQKGADVNAVINASGLTPLHLAAMQGDGPLVTYLIEQGADTNAKDRAGDYPLDLAPNAGDAVKVLRARNAAVHEIIHTPVLFPPPGGYQQYNRASNLLIMQRSGTVVYYYNRHGKYPRLYGKVQGEVVLDPTSGTWRPAEDNPYAR